MAKLYVICSADDNSKALEAIEAIKAERPNDEIIIVGNTDIPIGTTINNNYE